MKNLNLVQKLRDRNFGVKVTHYRRYISWENKLKLLTSLNVPSLMRTDFVAADIVELPSHESPSLRYALPKGGFTTVEVTTPSGKEYFAESICSDKDQFNRKLATKIATNRILNVLRADGEWVD